MGDLRGNVKTTHGKAWVLSIVLNYLYIKQGKVYRNGVIIIGIPEKYEYCSYTELESISGNYFVIPAPIILNKDVSEKRISVFSFFSIRRGLDYKLLFSVGSILKWMNKQPDRHANGINNKIIEATKYLNDGGYITLSEEVTNTSYIDSVFNIDKITEDCSSDRFAIVYVDELQKIMNYQRSSSKDTSLNADIILLVFAYLRMKIYKRRNKLMPEEINLNNKNNRTYDIEQRKIRCPEAYDCYYYEIADILGLSSRIVSKAVTILNQIGLIYSEPLPRIKYQGKWRTDHTIFCNAYKREGNYLLADGVNYYLTEIENKKKKLNIINDRKI